MSYDDVLHLGRLEEAYEDDQAAIAELLGLACETELRYIKALREAIAAHQAPGVASAAHSIKGSASNIGSARVSRVAADIEDRARRGDWDEIPALIIELERRYSELRARVEQYAASIA